MSGSKTKCQVPILLANLFIYLLINQLMNQLIYPFINQSISQYTYSLILFFTLYLILGLLKKVGFENSDGPEGGLSLNDSILIVYKDLKEGRSGINVRRSLVVRH